MKLPGHILALTGMLSLSTHLFAFQQPANPRLANFDNRTVGAADESAPPEGKAAAVAELRKQLPNAKVDFHAILRAPTVILNRDGFLSGPGGSGGAISAANLAAVPLKDPNRITKAFLRQHRDLFGHGPETLEQARIKREFVSAQSGMRTVAWEQQVDGVPVFEALLVSHTTAKGELVNIASQFIPNPQQAADRGATNRVALIQTPNVSARQAVTTAARNIGETADLNAVKSLGASQNAEKTETFGAPFLVGESDAKLIWLPMDETMLRLCWDVTLTSRKRGEMFRILVDAQTGVVQVRHCLTDYLTDATYRVFLSDSPSPFSPGYATPVSTQPALVARSLVTLPALNTNASPLGWINDGGNETLGNNVDAHTDSNNDNLPDLPRPQGSPARVFDLAMDLSTQNPSAYSQAAVVQLFYWNNFMHDKLYELGFTEAAGNFQSNNFGRGGLGNDAVQADAQDGGGFNNANFSTPADGSPGRMQMYIFSGPTPQRDGDLDAEIVLHEYTHGLSNRRVGGGVGISALQPSGMGEGWSDFYGLSLLSEAGDDVNGVYAAGAYATYLLSGLTQNYYYGIRRYPYCTDMSKNPLTFKDIDPSQASVHTGIPRSSIIGTTADEVHNMGEVWCVTLWGARANLITKYGWALGNQRMLQLVTDGMNLAPANPTFLQARDAIIQADFVDYGGANRAQLWTAFARRGMGLSATSPASSSTSGLVEAYDVPDDFQISPTVLSSSGPVGGPFSPNPAVFTLLNMGTNTFNWSLASGSGGWFTISPTNGTLAGGAGATVSVTISGAATNFSLGGTNSIVWFTNQTSGIAQSRTFNLNVVGRTLFENCEPDVHLSLWSGFGGTPGSTIIATNYGGSISGVNSLWFGDAGSRFATTIPVDTSAGGSVSFYLHLGNGGSAPWEMVDLPDEGIVLEYSTNSGAAWTLIGTYATSTYYAWTQVTTNIPNGAISPATQFRWRQLSHSGTCCDHWALDDISIDAGPTPPVILTQPASQTVKSGSNVTFTVSAQGSFPLSYQWRKNGTNLLNGGRISGATDAALNMATLLESDSGQYSVVITNSYGSVTSSIATLLVTPLDHFEWSNISSPQAVGTAFAATITAKDFVNATVTNFNGTVTLSGAAGGGQVTNTILGAPTNSSSSSGDFTLGFSFTPNTNMTVTHVRHYYGTKVSIWTDAGVLLAAQNVTSAPGTWLETALATPLQLTAGVTYRVGAYTGGGTYLWRTGLGTNFPSGTMGQGYEFSGDAFPANADSVQWWFVDLRYTVNSGVPIVVTPASPGPFTNGVWSGLLTAQAPATNLVLRADETGGHSGLSNPFNVLLQNDLALSIVDSPDPVAVGANLTYSLTVANVGPSAATAVTVTNFLPPGVTFVSAVSSQGTCTQSAGVVRCSLGAMGGTNATVTIVVVPTAAGVLTNSAVVSRGEADPYPANNSAVSITTVLMPSLSIGDASVVEGNSGQTNMVFALQLSPPSPLTVTVNYGTSNGLAQAGSDYVGTNGILTFAPGQTNRLLTVLVLADTNSEGSETFFVNLSAPANATLSRSQAVGTILDDDYITVAVFDNPLYVDTTSGGVSAESDNVQASLTNRNFRVVTFTNIATAVSANNVLLFPEFEVRSLALDLTVTERSALSNFVTTGGLIIVNGQGPNAGAFINSVFGFAVAESAQSSGGTLFTRTGVAAGTHFADDPVSIIGNNGQITLGVSSLPSGSFSIYESSGQSAVAEIPVGAGKIVYLGWDWYNAAPIGTLDGGWLTILESAVLEVAPTPLGIVFQPASQTVKSGSNVSFTVTAQGSRPLAYQWRKNGTNVSDAGRISGATSSTLAISTVLETDIGQYSVVITNNSGSVTSSNATLMVTPLDHFAWGVISSPQAVAKPFAATITARDFLNATVTNFSGTVNLSGSAGGGQTTNTILGNLVFDGSGSGLYTLGFAFTPNTNILVTHVRSYSGTKVSIWQTNGTLLASQNVTSVPGTWVETALATPATLNAGSTYIVGFYTAGGTFYSRSDRTNTFPNGTLVNAYYYASADSAPTNVSVGTTVYLVDLRYTAGSTLAVPITPVTSGSFTNGIWSGNITAQLLATNVVLSADDGSGHTGASNPFQVVATNDLALTMSDSPDPVSAGANLTYSLIITNTGPAAASSVRVTNVLPAGVTFVSATASQGTCTQNSGTVSCTLGTIPGGTNATVTILVVPTIAGTSITNLASITRGEPDGYAGNNAATAVTSVTTPAISISDGTVAEGDAGSTNMVFAVTLAAPSPQTIFVNYATSDGTASASSDYAGTNGTLSFAPGTTNLSVNVLVWGDKTIESNENFTVTLSNPVNGVLGRSQAIGTILNDDGLPGLVEHFTWNAISSPQAVGAPFSATITAKDFFNNTVTNFNRTTALSGSAGGGQASNAILGNLVYATTSSGLYTLGFAFTPTNDIVVTHVRSYSGTKVSIWQTNGALVASQNVTSVPGTWVETPLAAPVTLSAGVTYVVGFYTAGGTYYMRSDRTNGFPNGTLVNAYYFTGADAFPSTVSVSQTVFLVDLRYTVGSSVAVPITPVVSGAFTNGIWTGNVTAQLLATNVVLRADDGVGHTGSSNPFDMVLQNDLSVTITDAPDPVAVGANLNYTLSVTNTGPAAATSVLLTNYLPASVNFSSATTSQGTYTQSGGVVICNVGTIPGGSNAAVSIVAVPTVAGVLLTNTTTISRAEPESYLSNNVATAFTTVTLPAISIADAGVVEGNVLSTNMIFAVTLGAPSAQTITASYTTANGTALSGSDYTFTNGTVTFAPGVTNQSVVVRVTGDTLVESDETLLVNLNNPNNGVLGRSQGIGTITNDDGFPGQVDHFAWDPITSPQLVNSTFTAAITALDASNTVVTNFNAPVSLSASVPITPVSGTFSHGVWTGAMAVQAFATNLVLRADDGDGHVGLSNPFHVITSNQPPVMIASPLNTTAYLGATAAFQVNVLGSAPLSYQWRLNGADLPGATNSTLNLNRVTVAQAGSYSVVAWNPFGTNSSAKATLSIVQVVAWGAGTNNTAINFNYAQSIVPNGITNAIQLSGGLYHSLVGKTDGKVSAWGAGTNNTQISPNYGQSIVPPLGGAVAVAGGGYHSLALRSDGSLVAWGAGSSNILSLPNYGQCIVPSLATNIVAIAAGDYHSVALRNDGRVLVWGYNGFQQTNVPTAATSNVVAIASRAGHVLALKSDGSLVHWGSLSSLPFGVTNIVTIAAGVNHCLALRSDGTVVSWGSQTTVPAGLSNVVDIAAGSDHNLALRSDGTVVTWGATNLYGRYQIPAGLSNFVGIACGYYHSIASLGDGSPLIKWQPVSRSALLNSPVSFYVLGVGPQLAYQWQFNGTNVPGATNFTLTIPSAQAFDAGSYQVVLANAFSSVTSAVANLNVLAPIGGAVDAPTLSWSTSGNVAWFGETTISHDGLDAAQSGRITESQQSSVQTSVSGPGVLTFWWKVSSEQYFDYLNFFVDSSQQASVSGDVDWQFQTVAIGSGSHTLKWTYQKDSSVSAGMDAGWLDQVLYTTNPPVITLQPIGQTNGMGATFSLSVSASGAPPITYQWFKTGTNVGGAVSSDYNIINATRHDSGTYAIVASNPGGSTSSSNAVVLIRVPQRLKSLVQPNGEFALLSYDADGGNLSPEDLGKFEWQSSSNLVDWLPLTNVAILTNGTLLLIDQDSTNYSKRFYRVVEH